MRAAQVSRMMSRQASFTAAAMNAKNGAKNKMQVDKEERELEADTVMARHIEQRKLLMSRSDEEEGAQKICSTTSVRLQRYPHCLAAKRG